MICPVCKSEDTRKYSVIWRGGTKETSTEGGIHGGGSYHSVNTSSTSQTLLAEKCSIPQQGGCIGAILYVLIFFLSAPMGFLGFGFAKGLFAGFCIGTVFFFLSFWLLLKLANLLYFNRSDQKHAEEIAKWEKKWLCMKCEHTFDYP